MQMSKYLQDTLREWIRDWLGSDKNYSEDNDVFPLEVELDDIVSLLWWTDSCIELRNIGDDYGEERYYMYHDPMKSILGILEMFEPLTFNSEEAIFQHLNHLYDKLVEHKESLTKVKSHTDKDWVGVPEQMANVIMEYVNSWEDISEKDLSNLIYNYLFEDEQSTSIY